MRGKLLGLSISIEVTNPEVLDSASVIKIGKAHCPYEDTEGMEIGEALQWAFATPQGVTELANLGAQWNVQYQ